MPRKSATVNSKHAHLEKVEKYKDRLITESDGTTELRLVVAEGIASYVAVEVRHMKGVRFLESRGKGYELAWRKRKAPPRKSRRRG